MSPKPPTTYDFQLVYMREIQTERDREKQPEEIIREILRERGDNVKKI